MVAEVQNAIGHSVASKRNLVPTPYGALTYTQSCSRIRRNCGIGGKTGWGMMVKIAFSDFLI